MSTLSLCPVGPALALADVNFLCLEYDTLCIHTFAHTRRGIGTHSFPSDGGLPTCSEKFPNLAIHFVIWASPLALGLWGGADHILLSSKGLSRAQAQSGQQALSVTGERWREISTSRAALQNVPSAHLGWGWAHPG